MAGTKLYSLRELEGNRDPKQTMGQALLDYRVRERIPKRHGTFLDFLMSWEWCPFPVYTKSLYGLTSSLKKKKKTHM